MSRKFLEFQEDSIHFGKIIEFSRNVIKCLEISMHFTKFQEISRHFNKFHKTTRTEELRGLRGLRI